MSVSLEELSKALNSLKEALELMKTAPFQDSSVQKIFRDATIQRFEYSLELSWKTSMKVLGSNIKAAKPAIREMARNNLLFKPDLWLTFVDSRNETSHAYDEDIAQKVFLQIQNFLPEALELLSRLQKISTI